MTGLYKRMMVFSAVLLLPAVGVCLTAGEAIRLKQGGVSDATIQLMIREKTVGTRAFTVDDILAMKKAGLSEKTLQMLIESNSFMQDRKPVVYGKDVRPLSFSTVDDVIALKRAGLSDDVIQAVILTIGDRRGEEARRAGELLRHLDIEIEYRKDSP